MLLRRRMHARRPHLPRRLLAHYLPRRRLIIAFGKFLVFIFEFIKGINEYMFRLYMYKKLYFAFRFFDMNADLVVVNCDHTLTSHA